jgi:hypothetical protein
MGRSAVIQQLTRQPGSLPELEWIGLADSEFKIRRPPMRVNLRGLGLYAEDLSRLVRRSWRSPFRFELRQGEGGRDSVKVAQYEVLGNDSKRHVRLVRDDRTGRLLISHAAQRLAAMVDRPVPPSSRRRFAVARPSLRGRAVARRAKVAS